MLRRLLHIIFALLIFVGSTGMVLNKNYCQDELKSAALFLQAKACHSDSMELSCPMHGGEEDHAEKEERKDCCDDQTEYLKVEEDQITPSLDRDLLKLNFQNVAIFRPKKIDQFSIDHQTLHYLNYKPPLIVCDLAVRFQTFLC